jgi:hypothetical protein
MGCGVNDEDRWGYERRALYTRDYKTRYAWYVYKKGNATRLDLLLWCPSKRKAKFLVGRLNALEADIAANETMFHIMKGKSKMDVFLEKLYSDLQQLENKLNSHGASKSMQSRARDARNAVTWLQEELEKK